MHFFSEGDENHPRLERRKGKKIAGWGRYSADIRRVQKEIDDLRASGRTGEKRQRNTYQ